MMYAKVFDWVGSAVVFPQAELTGSKLMQTIAAILDDQERVMAMGAASMTLRRIDAAEAIVRECYALIGDHHDGNQSLGAAGV
jgi:UDP-N-acetylglucosamine--N-acetylmuramyl-(pentapeptide) pyrophosphoryl-undecaprenol N-acetylglucosamine transferase